MKLFLWFTLKTMCERSACCVGCSWNISLKSRTDANWKKVENSARKHCYKTGHKVVLETTEIYQLD